MNMFFPGFGEAPSAERGLEQPIKDLIERLIPSALGPASSGILESKETDEGVLSRRADYQHIWGELTQRNLESVFKVAAESPRPKEVPATLPETGWLMFFMAHAGLAATESQQRAWGEVLGFEVAAPGSVGKRTLLMLSGLEDWELDLFRQFSSFAFAFESGWRFVFEEDMVRREMWSYSRESDLTHHWVELGLLATDTLHAQVASLRGLEIGYGNKRWEIRPASQTPETVAVTATGHQGFFYRKYTAVGQELASAMKVKTYNGFARNVIDALNGVSGFDYVLKEARIEP